MKKWLLLASLFMLAGCSDENNRAVSSVLPASEKEDVPEISSTVEVYTVDQSVEGQIVKVDERSKWVLVPASVVAHHPKALIVTSEGQQLEGQVVSFDEALNIAFIHFRNSSTVEASFRAYTSYNAKGEVQTVTVSDIEAFVEAVSDKPFTRVQRTEMQQIFKDYAPITQLDKQVLETYKKQTFTYNPDTIFAFTEHFHSLFTSFIQTGDTKEIEPHIATDSLLDTLRTLQTNVSNLQFTELELQAVQLVDHLFIVTGNCTFIEHDKEKTSKITYKIASKADEYTVISMLIE